jgi:hypothetical protein
MDRARTIKLLASAGALRRIPVARLLAVAEIVVLAREHFHRLEPYERHRFLELMRRGHGRPSHLTDGERAELAALIAKANPRLFAGLIAQKLSPVPLPKRMVRGKR